MNKLFTKIAKIFLGLSMAAGVGVAVSAGKKGASPVQAAEEVYKTALFGSSYNSKGVQDYTSTWYSTYSSFRVNVTNFNNNNNGWTNSSGNGQIKCGAKKAKAADAAKVTTGYIATNATIDKAITKVVVTVDAYSTSSSSSATTKLEVSASSDFSSSTQITPTMKSGDIIYTITSPATSKYYRISFTCTNNTTTNGMVTVSKVLFYHESVSTYSVSGTITNGELSSTASITHGNPLNITLNPSTHYHLPTSLTSVTMGGNTLVAGTGYTYNSGTGAISIASVTGNVVITATCPEDAKYTVTYVKGDHGTGSNYVVNNQYGDSYTLVPLATAGFTAHSGYAFKKWNVGGTEYDPGESITLSANTTVTAVWAEVVTLTYDKNGGTGTNSSVQVAKGSTITVVDCTFTAPSGKGFSKWNTAANGTGTSYSKDDTFTINSDTTLFAQWAIVLDISIDSFTEISTSYTTTYTHTYSPLKHDSTTASMVVEALGVYKNGGIQTNNGKATNQHISNQSALPGYITKIVIEWSSGTTKNTPTVYVNSGSAASQSSTSLGKGLAGSTQTYTVENGISDKMNYFFIDTNTVTGACVISHLYVYYDFLDELSSIAVNATQAQLTYTVGDTFSFAGSVTPTRLLSGVGSPTTSNLTFKLGGTSITAGSYTLTKADHGKTLNVTYTENGISKNANAAYSLIVNYEDVTSISLNLSSTSIGLEGSVDLTATILSANADPSVTWVVTPSASLVEDINYEYITEANELSLAMKEGNTATGTITVTATATGYVDDTETPDLRATCVVTVAGAKSVSLSLDSMSGYAGSGINHRGSITATANNFTSPTYSWSVVSETVSNMVTFSASTSATTYVNFVKAGTATIKCGAQEGGTGDFTYSDAITITVSSDSVDFVSWTGTDVTCYSGSSLTSSTISGWSPTYTMLSGDTGSISSGYTIKLDGTTYTLGTSLVAGEYEVSLTYGEKTTSVNPTLTVIQSINSVTASIVSDLTFTAKCGGSGTADDGAEWDIESDAESESTFDDAKGLHYGTGSSGGEVQYITLTSSSYNTGKITKVVVNASTASSVSATVSITVDGNAFGGSAQSLSSTATDYTFTGNVDAGEIVVTITKPSKAQKALYCKSVKVSTSSDISNSTSHYAAQKLAVDFANAFNDAMSETSYCTSGLSSAWSSCSSAYDTFKTEVAKLSSSEQNYAKNLIKYATAQYSDDSGEACIERMMKTYEVCVQKHGQTAFMSDLVTLGAPQVSPLVNIIGENTNTVAIIVIISMVSVTAIGGYFFLRTRKEN